MAASSDTRERVLRAAAGLFQRQGYGATGLTQVLTESRAPKGSMYFHFPNGKEQLATESVILSGRELGDTLADLVLSAPDGPAAMTALGEYFAAELERSDFRNGCPVATVALEASSDSEPIRAACDDTYASWLEGLTVAMRGWGIAEAESLAALVLSSLQGALLLARVQRDVTIIGSVTEQLAGLVARAASA
jgi:TetR/AcrR family transcriptional regulator, lmrAB and yxaGH operons repressor